jgi:hypothetical protein
MLDMDVATWRDSQEKECCGGGDTVGDANDGFD